MARIATNQSTVVQSVVTRLIAQVTDFTAPNCYEVAEPEPTVERSHNLFCQVSVGDGRFNDEAIIGGGINEVFEHSTVWVTLFSRLKLDQAQHAKQTLYDTSRGLLVLKGAILKALSGHDLMDTGGNQILIGYMAPLSSARPVKEWEGFSSISVAFSTDFEWDLIT